MGGRKKQKRGHNGDTHDGEDGDEEDGDGDEEDGDGDEEDGDGDEEDGGGDEDGDNDAIDGRRGRRRVISAPKASARGVVDDTMDDGEDDEEDGDDDNDDVEDDGGDDEGEEDDEEGMNEEDDNDDEEEEDEDGGRRGRKGRRGDDEEEDEEDEGDGEPDENDEDEQSTSVEQDADGGDDDPIMETGAGNSGRGARLRATAGTDGNDECEDRLGNTECQKALKLGQCLDEGYQAEMIRHCALTCRFCKRGEAMPTYESYFTPRGCRDTNENTGECQKHAAWWCRVDDYVKTMIQFCAMTCRRCPSHISLYASK